MSCFTALILCFLPVVAMDSNSFANENIERAFQTLHLGNSDKALLIEDDSENLMADNMPQVTPIGYSGATPPLGASGFIKNRAEVNDIVVATPSATYKLSSTSGAIHQKVRVPLQITVGTNKIKEAVIAITHAPSSQDIANINFVLPYDVEWLPEIDQYIERYEIIDNEVQIYLKDTDKTNYSFSVAVNYVFNVAEYERQAPVKRDIGQIVTEAYSSGMEVFSKEQPAYFYCSSQLDMSQSGIIVSPKGSVISPGVRKLTMMDNEELKIMGGISFHKESQKFQLNRTREFAFLVPVGVEITAPPFGDKSLEFTIDKGPGDEGVEIPDNYYKINSKISVPGGKYYKLTAVLPETDPGNWPVAGDYEMNSNLYLKFPPVSAGAEEETYGIYQIAEAYGVYDVESTVSAFKYDITVRDHNIKIWSFNPDFNFVTTNSNNTVYTNVENQNFAVKTGGTSYGSVGGYNNTGTKNISSLRFQSYFAPASGKLSNIKITSINMSFFRENTEVSFPGGRYIYIVGDAKTNQMTQYIEYIDANELNKSENALTITKTVKLPEPTEPNQYIFGVSFEPMAENMVNFYLQPKTGVAFGIASVNWPDNKYPNDTAAQKGDQFDHVMDVFYADAEDKMQQVTKKIRYAYVEDGIRPYTTVNIKNLTNPSNNTFYNPKDRLELKTGIYNYPPLGLQNGYTNWVDPTILIRVPKETNLEFGEDFAFKNSDNTKHSAKSEIIEENDDYKIYKLTTEPGVFIKSSNSLAEFGPYYYTVSETISYGIEYPLIKQIGTLGNLNSGNIYETHVSNPAETQLFGLPDGKGGGFRIVNIKINPWPYMESGSKIRSTSFPAWSSEEVVIAGVNEQVEHKLSIDNKGNTSFKNLKLYNIMPRAGVNGSSANMVLEFLGANVNANDEIYYFHGEVVPPLEDIDKINYTSGEGWNKNAKDAKAFIVVMNSSQQLHPQESISAIIKYKTPSSKNGNQTAVTQFSYSAMSDNNQQVVFVSARQAFKTDVYSVEYFPQPEDAEITNMPADVSGAFTDATEYKVPVTNVIPVRRGYEFTGWNTATDGSGSAYSAGEIITIYKESLPHVYLYPQWIKKEFTVTFDPNGGELTTPESINVIFGEAIPEPVISPPYGYTLSGWYQDETNIWNFANDKMPDRNVTLKAKWTVSGTVDLIEVPDLEFGVNTIPKSKTSIYITSPVSLKVKDSRPLEQVSNWSVAVKAENLTIASGPHSGYNLPAESLCYYKDGSTTSLSTPYTVFEGRGMGSPDKEIHTKEWTGSGSDEIVLLAAPEYVLNGSYKGSLVWSISVAP